MNSTRIRFCVCVQLLLTWLAASARAQFDDDASAGAEAAEVADDVVQAPQPEAAASKSEADPDHGFSLVMTAGAGAGGRFVHLPTGTAARELHGWSPAFDVALLAAAAVSPRASLGLHVRYQSSLGMTANEQVLNEHRVSTSLRTHDVGLGLSAGVRFADSAHAVSAHLLAGYGMRGLRSVIELRIPAYTLQGPLVRLELVVPFASGAVELRLAPEAQWLTLISGALRTQGTMAARGYALGGEAALGVRVAKPLCLQLAYRENHARVQTHWADAFRDVERFATLRALLVY